MTFPFNETSNQTSIHVDASRLSAEEIAKVSENLTSNPEFSKVPSAMQTEALNKLYAELAEKLFDEAVNEVKPPQPKKRSRAQKAKSARKPEKVESDEGSQGPSEK